MKSWWVLLLTLIATPVAAQDFGARYPAGSIRDGEQAQTVLKEADAEMARIAQSAKAREAECLRGFFVNSCRDEVRRQKELAEREVRRVRVEARDVQRRIEAERVAKRRSDEEAPRAAEDAKRAQKVSKAREAATAREAAAKQREALAPKGGTPAQASEQDRLHHTPTRMTADERAENVRKFQQKQEQAQKRALEQEAKRLENEQRRIEKRKQLEQQEAAREEVRKKAAASIK
jgi:hypothetical protein